MISETLRLYPASYITARESLREVEIEGHAFWKGTLVLISQWARHRDPRVFDDPDPPMHWRGPIPKGK